MKKSGLYVLFLFIMMSLYSCFDVIEKVKINDDGSGSFTFLINASKSKVRIQSALDMGSFNHHKLPTKADIEADIKEIKNAVSQTEGMSNVKTSVDLSNFIVSISGNFKNIDCLDNAIRKVKTSQKYDNNFPTNWYTISYDNKTFKKNTIPSYSKQYSEMSAADKKIFSEATYTAIFQFESSVKSNSNSNYKLSSTKKSVKNTGKILDYIQKKRNPETTIILN